MKKQALSIIAVLVLCMALGACKKEREVDVNKLKNIFVEGISKEPISLSKTVATTIWIWNGSCRHPSSSLLKKTGEND